MKQAVRKALRLLGYDIRRVASSTNNVVGQDPWDDMASFLDTRRPLVFDVGANTGQSVRTIRTRFPGSILHSFEPSPSTFTELEEKCGGLPDVSLWNCGLGSGQAEKTLLENFRSDMSSFLPLGASGWGMVVKETRVMVDTIDAFCTDKGIVHIDILKSDTQGYDFEVLKGAEGMMASRSISLIYFEVIFSDMYRGVGSFDQAYELLIRHGFRLVSFYDLWYQGRLASATDALFVHESAIQSVSSESSC